VKERDHRVCFAAAEVRLQLYDRIAPVARPAPNCVAQQLSQPVGQEGTAEKLNRLAVLIGSFVPPYLMKISGELRLKIPARCDIRVRRDNFSPGS
jgi:hypothetical protein